MFSQTHYSVILIAVASFWNSMGYSMLLLMAAMVMVPRDILESAQIDGAGEWKCFFYMFLPQIRPTFLNIVLIHYIWAVSIFEIPFMLGGINGGVNKSMDFISINYYRVAFGVSYTANRVGFGTTIAMVVSSIVLIGTIVQMNLFNKNGLSE
jgi:ABC-type sugar transport system permease subunit